MNILIIGSGGREQAIAWQIGKSPKVKKIYLAPGNGGTADLNGISENVSISPTDFPALIEFVSEKGIDLTIVGPEQPLELGIVDEFQKHHYAIIGPSKAAAQLETSKAFAKDAMKRFGIPTAGYALFTTFNEASRFVTEKNKFPIVIKASGLAAGKGVVIADSESMALNTLDDFFNKRIFGNATDEVVIEEFLQGEEASVFALCDGTDFILLPDAQDHKRIGEGDTGKNTGGMGAYSPALIITDEVREKVEKRIIRPLLDGMRIEGIPYTGFLYVGLMIHEGNPSVVEFNARLGDPETQVILPRLESDFLSLLEASLDGTLCEQAVSISRESALTVVMVSGGYPDSYQTGKAISGQCHFEEEECKLDVEGKIIVFHSGTKREQGKLKTAGGRVLSVTAVSSSLKQAQKDAYEACSQIYFEGVYYRKDIGYKGVERESLFESK
ncbi:MAG: phosphoribosylamine--glycine ligase [Chloroherpetonaceae bacterium]|nr:phosphoribosylamine--glycine ligase [Chloroherpetonaceae bacterium]